MATSIFDTILNKILILEAETKGVISGIQRDDILSYNSISSLSNNIQNIRNDIDKEFININNELKMSQATQAAASSAGSAVGVSMSLENILKFINEIKKAAQCFIELGKIVILIGQILILLIAKVSEVGLLVVKVGAEKSLDYLSNVKSNVIQNIISLKSQAVKDSSNDFYTSEIQSINKDINNYNNEINIEQAKSNKDLNKITNLQNQVDSLIFQKDYFSNQIV